MADRNMLAVNGVWQPNPAGVEIAYSAMDKIAERDMAGRLYREIAAKKIKYVLNWPYLPDNAAFAAMWNTLAALPEFAWFTLPHPDGTMHTFEGYIGDMGVTMLSYWDMGTGSQARWKSFKVNIIER